MKGVVLAGTSSGVGKTVATLATIRALADAGYAVQPAKAGPDFIDPSHHAVVADRPSRTLDLWLEGADGLRRNYHRGEGDVCVVEGVMGLYDGDASSTAMVADALDLPVILVVDASAGMESVAATALGFRTYADRIGSGVDVVGVVAQRAHEGRHADGVREALPDDLTWFGHVPPDDRLEIPDRHLGLHLGEEAGVPDAALDAAAAGILTAEIATVAREPLGSAPTGGRDDTGGRVAVARDAAFRFVYSETIDRLGQRATVETFSPVAGDDLPPADAVYLPGGYPELHAEALAASTTLDDVATAATEGTPVYGECGGFMALAESLETTDGEIFEMAGVLPAEVRMCDRYQALDHVELQAERSSPLAPSGAVRRGHEFHYSTASVAGDANFVFDVERGTGMADGRDGLTEYRTVGTYAHVHPESGMFDTFVERAVGEPD